MAGGSAACLPGGGDAGRFRASEGFVLDLLVAEWLIQLRLFAKSNLVEYKGIVR